MLAICLWGIVGEHNMLKPMFFQGCWSARTGLVIHVRPPTSDGHNFFVRTPFRVLLDSMEIPLSQNSNHVSVEDIG